MIAPEPETIEHIMQQRLNGRIAWQCGCELRGERWYLCNFHQGYDDGIEYARTLRPTDPLDFGDDSDDVFTNEQIATVLLDYICPAGQPHTADDPTTDHGHTQCMWIGLAIQRLRATP